MADRLFKSTKTTTIPHLTALRKTLGYDNPGQQEDIAFKRAIKEQLGTFVSSGDKISGYKLTKWTSPSHQRGLLEITKDFLDNKGNGPLFWPDRHSSTDTRPLEYSKDSKKIRCLMIKVFWRAAREYKRYKVSTPTIPQVPSQPSKATETLPEATSKVNNTHPRVVDKVHDPRGNSVDDPIDLETMTSSTSVPGPSKDIDHFLSFEFTLFAARSAELADEMSGSDPSQSSVLPPDVLSDILDCRPLEPPNSSQTVQPANMHGTDLYDGPESSPVTQTAQTNGKRPAETNHNDNNHQAKIPRQDPSVSERQSSNASKAGRKTKSVAPQATRVLDRARRKTVHPNGATEEEMQALDKSPTPSSPECVRHANQDQQAKDKAGGPSSKTPAPRHGIASGQRQPSIEDRRAGAALSAERQTAAAAAAATITTAATNAAPVVEQQPSVTAGLSARAQGKQPALPETQTTATQAGSSRERELLEAPTSRPEVNSTRTENNLPPPETSTAQSVGTIEFNEEEQAAVDASRITYRHKITRANSYVTWKPSSMIFHMSLADIARELGVVGSRRLYFNFRGRLGNVPDDFASSDEERFTSFMYECLRNVTDQYLSPAARRQGLRYYQLYISDAPIRISEG
ncbi:Ff.00g091030.m01.CDS01 [Fusarium sp. VM40]|nr:Ff.00g091030.m01.CDS01 [Fusarium sp. VM40]